MANTNKKAVVLTSDVPKSNYNGSSTWQMSPLMFEKINNKIPGKCGNQRSLLIYLIFQQQNGNFHPAEETICRFCGFTTASRYHEARDALEERGFISHTPYKEIKILYENIMA